MQNPRSCFLIVGLCIVAGLFGCSGGVARTDPVQVSQEDLAKSQVFRANQVLDQIEKLPASQHQFVADLPKNSEALYAASQTDANVKKRIDDLGLKLSPPKSPKPLHR